MAIMKAKHEFFDLISRVFASREPLSALFDMRFDHGDVLTALNSINLAAAQNVTLSRNLLRATFASDAGDLQLEVRGSDFGPVRSLPAFLRAWLDGTVRGDIASVTLRQGDEVVLEIGPATNGVQVVSGQQVLTIEGSLPTALADLSTLFQLLTDPSLLDGLTEAQRQAIFDRFADKDMTGLTLTDGDATLLHLEITDHSLEIELAGLRLVLGGTLPDSMGNLIEAYYLSSLENGPGIFGLLGATDLRSIDIYNSAGKLLLDSKGNAFSLIWNWVIEGQAVTDDMDMIWSPFEKNMDIMAEAGRAAAMIGSFGRDRIVGADKGDHLLGLSGDDDMNGMGGRDTLRGWSGDDRLSGGKGDDVLFGGKGDDVLRGGAGSDRFVFAKQGGMDRVYGFSDGHDLIVIRSGAGRVLEISVEQEGNDAVLRFGGTTVRLMNADANHIDAADFLFT